MATKVVTKKRIELTRRTFGGRSEIVRQAALLLLFRSLDRQPDNDGPLVVENYSPRRRVDITEFSHESRRKHLTSFVARELFGPLKKLLRHNTFDVPTQLIHALCSTWRHKTIPEKALVVGDAFQRNGNCWSVTIDLSKAVQERVKRSEQPLSLFDRPLGKIGQQAAYICALEFSRRGLPHLHMLVEGGISREDLRKECLAIAGDLTGVPFARFAVKITKCHEAVGWSLYQTKKLGAYTNRDPEQLIRFSRRAPVIGKQHIEVIKDIATRVLETRPVSRGRRVRTRKHNAFRHRIKTTV